MNVNEARFIGHEQAKGDNIRARYGTKRIFMLSWRGLLDLNVVDIPLGIFRTEEYGSEAALNIGPDMCREGTITLYRTLFPGFFIGAIPIKRWSYETYHDESGIERGRLSDLRIIDDR